MFSPIGILILRYKYQFEVTIMLKINLTNSIFDSKAFNYTLYRAQIKVIGGKITPRAPLPRLFSKTDNKPFKPQCQILVNLNKNIYE